MKKMILALLLFALMAAAPAVKHLQLTSYALESEFPSIAWTGSKLGVAWMDGRSGNLEIFFTTADMNAGSVGAATRITHTETWDDRPEVVWTGSDFGMTWIWERKTKFDLKFITLSSEGRPKGKPRNLITQGWLGKETGLCWTGAGYGIVYTKFQGSLTQGDLFFMYLNESGAKQGSVVTLSTAPGIKSVGALVRMGTEFGLFYRHAPKNDIFLLKLDPFGNPRGVPIQLNLHGTSCGLPTAAANGDVIVAAWTQKASSGDQVMVRALSIQGTPVGAPAPITAPGPSRPAVAMEAGPEGFGIAWIELIQGARALHFAKLDSRGQLAYGPLRLSKPTMVRIMSHRLDMGRDNNGFVIAWVDLVPPMNTEIVLSRVGF